MSRFSSTLTAGWHSVFPRRTVIALVAGTLAAALVQPSLAADNVDLSGVTLRVGIFDDVRRDSIEGTDFLKGTPYKIQWARLNGAGPTVQALGGNAIDLSWGLSDTAAPKASAEDRANWTAENAPIKIVALLKPFQEETLSQALIAAHKDSGVKSLADLRGKTYAFNEGGNINALALLALAKGGLTLGDVQQRLLTYDATSTALIAGAVAAAPVTRSRVAEALEDGTLIELARDIDVDFPGFTSVTARTESIADPAVGAAISDFLNRLAKYLKWDAEHPEHTAKSYVRAQQLSEKAAFFAARAGANTLIPVNADGEGFRKEVVATEKLANVGFYPRPVDFSTVVDDRFTDAILAGNAEK